MGSIETWEALSKIIGEISDAAEDKRRMELLSDLKTAMGNLSRQQLAEHMQKFDLQILFTCLNSEKIEQVHNTCEILKTLMLVLDPVICLEKYHEDIVNGFLHPVAEVPALIISHLTRCIEASEESLDKYPHVRTAIINQLASDDLSAATEADKFLLKYGTYDAGSNFLKGDEAINAYKALLDNPTLNDSKKFRVYENITYVATLSKEHFDKFDKSVGIMDKLITLSFKSDDFLGQINALEILANLVGCSHGQEALDNKGVFQEIKTLVDGLSTSGTGEILLPGIIKFIGKVGAVKVPSEDMVNLVFKTLLESGNDFALKCVCTEAIAYIGSTPEGKKYLKSRTDIKSCFEVVRYLIFEGTTQYRSRGLDAMSLLFGSDEDNEDCLPFWFNYIFHDMSELFEMVRLPFPELRISAITLLSAIAHLEWAQRHYLRGPGVVEFLISREPEPVKECVYAKYRLVTIIASSPTAGKFLTPENLAMLKLYVHQGPFYAQAESTVATSGAQ